MAEEADGFVIVETRNAFEIASDIAVEEREGADEIRPAREAAKTFDGHEEGVIAANIIGAAVFNEAAPDAFRGAGVAVMNEVEVVEATCGPAETIGFDLVHGVPARGGPKAADGFPTFTAIDFRGASDVKGRATFEELCAILEVADHAAADAESGVVSEAAKTFFKVG